MKKLYLYIALIIIFSLTACGGGSGSGSKDSSSVSADSSSSVEVSGEVSSESESGTPDSGSSSNSEPSGGVSNGGESRPDSSTSSESTGGASDNASSAASSVKVSPADLGWEAQTGCRLGFYLPPIDGLVKEETGHQMGWNTTFVAKNVMLSNKWKAYGDPSIEGNFSTKDESAADIDVLKVDIHTIYGTEFTVVTSEETLPFILAEVFGSRADEQELYAKTDNFYLYKTGEHEVCLFPVGSGIYYKLYVGDRAFDEYIVSMTISGPGSSYVYQGAGYFNEETYNMFLDSLVYLGK